MTVKKKLKRAIRELAEREGITYTEAKARLALPVPETLASPPGDFGPVVLDGSYVLTGVKGAKP